MADFLINFIRDSKEFTYVIKKDRVRNLMYVIEDDKLYISFKVDERFFKLSLNNKIKRPIYEIFDLSVSTTCFRLNYDESAYVKNDIQKKGEAYDNGNVASHDRRRISTKPPNYPTWQV